MNFGFLRTVAVAGGLAFAAQGAAAATFGFADLATGAGGAGKNEAFWINNSSTGNGGGAFDDPSNTWTVDGIGVSAFGNTYAGGSGDPTTGAANFAYLDGPSGSRPGGLGVCASEPIDATTGEVSATAGECNNSADDNTGLINDGQNGATAMEYVTLTFTTSVGLTDLILRGDNHNVLADGSKIGISQGVFTGVLMDFVVGTTKLVNLGASDTWTFAKISGGDNFYIDTATVGARTSAPPIPVPAAGFLLVGALGGLGLMRRRRKS